MLSLILSVLLHGVILFYILFSWHKTTTSTKSNLTKNNILQAYTYTSPVHSTNKIKSEHLKQIKANQQTTKNKLEKTKTDRQETNDTKTVETNTTNNNASFDSFIVILHAAIQAQQQYPRSALMQQQTGTVTVGFVLFPDGHIENIKIINSSGIENLDQAGIAAVENAMPIKEATEYLNKPKNFSINLHFNSQ